MQVIQRNYRDNFNNSLQEINGLHVIYAFQESILRILNPF
jgi:hypothetical protein